MFGSRVTGTFRQLGGTVETVSSTDKTLEALKQKPYHLLVIDLECPGVNLQQIVMVAQTVNVPVVAYASHIREALLESASLAGATEVHPRSRFSAQIETIIGRYVP